MRVSFWIDESKIQKIKNDEKLKNYLAHMIGFYFGVTPDKKNKVHVIIVVKEKNKTELIEYLKENYNLEAKNL